MAGRPLTVHIHIGAGKVGSTSIQDAATTHRETLAAAGVLYPVNAVWPRSHAALARELRGVDHSGSVELLGEVLARHDGDVLLSSEFFNAVPIDGLETLRLTLGDRPVLVVVYLRPYTEWMSAAYAYQAKRGRFLDDFDAFYASKTVRFGKRIQRWAAIFGWANLRIRTLEEVGDVVADLATVIGVPLPAVPSANVRPAWTAVETARWLAARSDVRPPLATIVARVDAAHRELGLPLQADYLTGDQRRALTEQWRGDLERIAAATGRTTPTVPDDDRSRPWLPTFERVPAEVRAAAAEWLDRA